MIPLRLRVDPPARFAELAKRVSAELRAIRPHQRYRYEDLKHDLGYGVGSRRLFGPVVNLMPFDPPPKLSGLELGVVPVSAGPVEDLALTVAPRTNGSRFDMEANPDAYTEAALAQHRAALLDVIDALTNAPDTRVADLPVRETSRASRASAIVSGGALEARRAATRSWKMKVNIVFNNGCFA
jgi:hypothetical protein